jgi:hypothetical protein
MTYALLLVTQALVALAGRVSAIAIVALGKQRVLVQSLWAVLGKENLSQRGNDVHIVRTTELRKQPSAVELQQLEAIRNGEVGGDDAVGQLVEVGDDAGNRRANNISREGRSQREEGGKDEGECVHLG